MKKPAVKARKPNKALIQLREFHKLSQRKFAAALGIPWRTLQDAEVGLYRLPESHAQLIAASTGVSGDDLRQGRLKVIRSGEPYTKKHLEIWRSKIHVPDADRARKEADAFCAWIRVLFDAAVLPQREGKPLCLPSLCHSLTDWLDSARRYHKLDRPIAEVLKRMQSGPEWKSRIPWNPGGLRPDVPYERQSNKRQATSQRMGLK